jgi:hypothetical protein
MPTEPVLNQKYYTDLNRAASTLNRARLLLEQAKRANIDVGERCEVCDELEQHIEAIKKAYFPGRR